MGIKITGGIPITQSLYDQTGGAPAVDGAVDLCYRKVLTDESISHFFDYTDMDEQRAKQMAFLTMVLGGPHEYTPARTCARRARRWSRRGSTIPTSTLSPATSRRRSRSWGCPPTSSTRS